MITFTYTPIGGGTVVSLPLLQSDRFWPAQIDFNAQGKAQVSEPTRAATVTVFGRGEAVCTIQFEARRNHATIGACLAYLKDVEAALGNSGTLLITYPGSGGGSVKSVGCVMQSASGHGMGIRSYIQFSFIGPKLVAGP